MINFRSLVLTTLEQHQTTMTPWQRAEAAVQDAEASVDAAACAVSEARDRRYRAAGALRNLKERPPSGGDPAAYAARLREAQEELAQAEAEVDAAERILDAAKRVQDRARQERDDLVLQAFDHWRAGRDALIRLAGTDAAIAKLERDLANLRDSWQEHQASARRAGQALRRLGIDLRPRLVAQEHRTLDALERLADEGA